MSTPSEDEPGDERRGVVPVAQMEGQAPLAELGRLDRGVGCEHPGDALVEAPAR